MLSSLSKQGKVQMSGSNHLQSKSDVSWGEAVTCGAAAGLVTRFCVAPLDLVKIRLQLIQDNSIARTVGQIVKNEGIRAFWKGNVPAEFLYVTYSASQFVTLRTSNRILSQTPVLSEPVRQLISGSLAGSVAIITTYPLDFLRTHRAAHMGRNQESLLNFVHRTWHNTGIKGFYHGASASVMSIVPYMGIFFATYSYLRDDNSRLKLPSWLPGIFTASSVASFVSKAASFPLDTIRKKVQVHGTRSYSHSEAAGYGRRYSHNFLICGGQIIKGEGIRGLYRGLGVGLLKAWPGSVLTIFFFEQSLNILRSSYLLL